MEQTRLMPMDDVAVHDRCRDWIEQKIVRAYVQLAVVPDNADGSCTVTLGRFGCLEVRLTEMPGEGLPNLPRFWLELYADGSDSVVDSFGCGDFDEDELEAAVTFVQAAMHRSGILH
ncbi:hypothetical protein [Microvirga yunnanensis]|uniref:hypothetical protein n=1 Tax=Microvirga yunnanensis TaxID=2953740 RepID=UPI0021C620EB|nr:hypothetical protein [Microvirga sp. HBU65207]